MHNIFKNSYAIQDPEIVDFIKHIDFSEALETDLYDIDVPLKYNVNAASVVHGLAFWFDVAFNGSK